MPPPVVAIPQPLGYLNVSHDACIPIFLQLSMLFWRGLSKCLWFFGGTHPITYGFSTQRLHDLEAAGLIERTVIPSSPPMVEYRLTARGRRLGPIIEAMRAYAREPVG